MTEKMELEKEKEGIIIDKTGGIMVKYPWFFKIWVSQNNVKYLCNLPCFSGFS